MDFLILIIFLIPVVTSTTRCPWSRSVNLLSASPHHHAKIAPHRHHTTRGRLDDVASRPAHVAGNCSASTVPRLGFSGRDAVPGRHLCMPVTPPPCLHWLRPAGHSHRPHRLHLAPAAFHTHPASSQQRQRSCRCLSCITLVPPPFILAWISAKETAWRAVEVEVEGFFLVFFLLTRPADNRITPRDGILGQF